MSSIESKPKSQGLESHDQAKSFRSIATIALSGITGLMIALPFAQTTSPLIGLVALAAGLGVGYRRRKDQWFFYLVACLCLIVTSVLAGQIALK
jgi:hypothetical protein